MILVERRDTRTIVGSLPAPRSGPLRWAEEQRSAYFGAWRFGATCWARDSETGRVLHVARPDQTVGFPAPLIGGGVVMVCCWPGCPQFTWGGDGRDRWAEWLHAHAKQPHVLCGCGRFFTDEGWRKHRGQVRRRDRTIIHAGPLLAMRLRPLARVARSLP